MRFSLLRRCRPSDVDDDDNASSGDSSLVLFDGPPAVERLYDIQDIETGSSTRSLDSSNNNNSKKLVRKTSSSSIDQDNNKTCTLSPDQLIVPVGGLWLNNQQ